MIDIKDLKDTEKLLKDCNNSLDNYDKKYCYEVIAECDDDSYELCDVYDVPFRTLEQALFNIGVHYYSHDDNYIYHINRYINEDIGTITLDKKDFEIVK